MKNNLLPIYVVSLPDSDRKNNFPKDISDMHFEFVNAFYGRNYISEINRINKETTCINRYNREISPGEYGCTMSHLSIYEKLIESDFDWVIIFEDDVKTKFNFHSELSNLAKEFDDDALFILGSQNGLPSFDNVVLKKQPTYCSDNINFLKLLNSEKYIYRTASYMISKKSAKKLLDISKDEFYLADDWNAFFKKKVFNNIFYASLVDHPEVLSGQSVIESERSFKPKYSVVKKLGLFDFLRAFKILFRKTFIPLFYK